MNFNELKKVLSKIEVETELLMPRSDTQVQIPCPLAPWFHEKKTDSKPSLSIKFNQSPTLWKCFSCIPSFERLLTDIGMISFGDLKPGFKVWDGQQWRRIKKVIKSTTDELYVVKCFKNRTSLYFTGNHPIYSFGGRLRERKKNQYRVGSPVEIKRCDELKINDFLVYPLSHEEENIEYLEPHSVVKKEEWISKPGRDPKWLPEKVELNDDVLSWFGWYIAEGSSSSGERNCVFTLAFDEIDEAEEIKRIGEKYFGVAGIIYPNVEKGRRDIIFSNSCLSKYMKRMCGEVCHRKHIPRNFMNLPLSKLNVLIYSIWKGDGGVKNPDGEEYSIGQTSQELASQMWDILCKQKVAPSLYYQPAKRNKRAVHILRWRSSGVSNYSEYLGDWYCMQIAEIRRIKEPVEVVDIEVETSHKFVYNGVLVHNCNEGGAIWQLIHSYGALSGNQEIEKYALQILLNDKLSLSSELDRVSEGFDDWIYLKDRDIPYSISERMLEKFKPALQDDRSNDYLFFRGVQPGALVYDLRYDVHEDRIIFPVYSLEGRLVGVVGRSISDREPRYKNYFGFEATKYLGGLSHLRGRASIAIVEGFLDLAKAHYTFENLDSDVLCCWKGSLAPNHIKYLAGLGKPVTIWFDHDKTGERGWDKLLQYKHLFYSLKRIRWDVKNKKGEIKDVNEMSKAEVEEAYEKSLFNFT